MLIICAAETAFTPEKPYIGITNREGRLSTVDLLIKVTCFEKDVNNIFNIKRI
jgi:hypothetical protein